MYKESSHDARLMIFDPCQIFTDESRNEKNIKRSKNESNSMKNNKIRFGYKGPIIVEDNLHFPNKR